MDRGDCISYSYDNPGRTSTIGYEDNAEAVKYTYDNNGNLGILTDNISGRKTKYAYDFQDRLMRYEEAGSNYSNTVQWGYDDKNNLSSQTQTLDGYPALFDGVNIAIWNARRYAWDGQDTTPMRLVRKHTQAEADDAFAFLRRMLALGADVQATDRYGRGVLMEAVEETGRLRPIRSEENGEFYPGRPVTEEMRHDIRRIFRLLIDAGADRENRSAYSGKTIRQHYEGSPVWELCGDLFG